MKLWPVSITDCPVRHDLDRHPRCIYVGEDLIRVAGFLIGDCDYSRRSHSRQYARSRYHGPLLESKTENQGIDWVNSNSLKRCPRHSRMWQMNTLEQIRTGSVGRAWRIRLLRRF